jgi:hypothetical protein
LFCSRAATEIGYHNAAQKASPFAKNVNFFAKEGLAAQKADFWRGEEKVRHCPALANMI